MLWWNRKKPAQNPGPAPSEGIKVVSVGDEHGHTVVVSGKNNTVVVGGTNVAPNSKAPIAPIRGPSVSSPSWSRLIAALWPWLKPLTVSVLGDKLDFLRKVVEEARGHAYERNLAIERLRGLEIALYALQSQLAQTPPSTLPRGIGGSVDQLAGLAVRLRRTVEERPPSQQGVDSLADAGLETVRQLQEALYT
jgi:hypothetical protein